MKSTYRPTNTRTDWHKVEIQCTMAILALGILISIAAALAVREIKTSTIDIMTPLRQLWDIASFRVMAALVVIIIPFFIAGITAMYLQRKQPNN